MFKRVIFDEVVEPLNVVKVPPTKIFELKSIFTVVRDPLKPEPYVFPKFPLIDISAILFTVEPL